MNEDKYSFTIIECKNFSTLKAVTGQYSSNSGKISNNAAALLLISGYQQWVTGVLSCSINDLISSLRVVDQCIVLIKCVI